MAKNIKIALAITVFNEETNITKLLDSFLGQTRKPDEIIIVDGGSTDRTVEKMRTFKKAHDKKGIIKIIEPRRANRPEGRNIGIKAASADIIAITDAGCVLDKHWVEEITAPLKDPHVDVVSGYYKAVASSVFEQCVAVYTLVMPERIDPREFLPSARSMAVRKKVWKEAGGFPENFPFNEDYVFAHRLKRLGKTMYFTKKAIVYWSPRETFAKAFFMFYYFALGDAEARIFRPKVVLIFSRYVVGMMFLAVILSTKSYAVLTVFLVLLIVYILWSIFKNFRYVNHWKAIFFLPLLQFASDVAVILGTGKGLVRKN